MTKLKPCPFCGGEPTIDKSEIGAKRPHAIRLVCSVCKIQTDWFEADVNYCAMEMLTIYWNTRNSEERVIKNESNT